MTFKSSLLVAFSAITLTAAIAEAYIVPGRGPAPIPNPRPEPPPYPGFPGQDDFGNGSGRLDQRIIYLGRRVSNETLELRQLAGINESYRGYEVESVEVEINRSGPRAEVSLLTDGRVDETAFSPQGSILLRPRYRAKIGEDIRTLQLLVRGNADIASIRISLREPDRIDRPGRPGRPDRGIEVPLYVSRRMYGNDRLNLSQYIDAQRYRGYRIQQIEIEATPVYNTALIDVLINGFNQGQTLQVDRYNSRQTVIPQNAIIGQGADSIVLITRGDLDIHRVTLRLSVR
ncbi:MAG: hypothetical protein OM95_11415 [Bdellovibrio sp. ArHS]|uniref:hypothetical protein n=1 Tax=Bdellovibrio sp. ArHS TaxID=1569284 RepID=UPI0005827661|nr:hypothetical protein [Bdellovibrio sp. ArHS]KHD88111.1 MAG: hypothetical protein OM95_11415 [Bdellovibrio sp. ArHS]